MSQVQADLSNSCLTVEADPKTRNCWELRMLEENRIEGLLPLSVCDDNGVLRLSYDTAGTEPLSLYTDTAQLKAADLRRLILTLKHVITGMKPFLLEPAGIVLSPESVCLDLRSHSPRFLYLPCRKTAAGKIAIVCNTEGSSFPAVIAEKRRTRKSSSVRSNDCYACHPQYDPGRKYPADAVCFAVQCKSWFHHHGQLSDQNG